MATQAQIKANRRNAQKSTGPKTPDGKALASKNALKHGFCSPRTLLSTEDPDEFQAHCKSLYDQYQPVGPMETILVNRIVTLTWQLNRASRLQACTFNTLIQDRHRTAGMKEKPDPRRLDYYQPELMEELGVTSHEYDRIIDKKGYPGWRKHVQMLIEQHQMERIFTAGPENYEDMLLGEVAFNDFSQSRAVERLGLYERRIESSLYKTHCELQRLQTRRKTNEQKLSG